MGRKRGLLFFFSSCVVSFLKREKMTDLLERIVSSKSFTLKPNMMNRKVLGFDVTRKTMVTYVRLQ